MPDPGLVPAQAVTSRRRAAWAGLTLVALVAVGGAAGWVHQRPPERPLPDLRDGQFEATCIGDQPPDPALGDALVAALQGAGALSPQPPVLSAQAYRCRGDADRAWVRVVLSDCGSSRAWLLERTEGGWGRPTEGSPRRWHCHDGDLLINSKP